MRNLYFVVLFTLFIRTCNSFDIVTRTSLSSGLSSTSTSHKSSSNNLLTSEVFSLDSVRSTLIRQEETIIFALIERAQYRRNNAIYDTHFHNLTNAYNSPISFLEWMFIETEKLHAKVRRYTSPEEHPFFPAFLPVPVLPALSFPNILQQKTKVNVNSEVMRWYLSVVIDRLCDAGDDEQHGSSVLCDITAMQALSRRIHFGKFVAGCNFNFALKIKEYSNQ
jgi:chorismate mutase